jgi:hypothetical protein
MFCKGLSGQLNRFILSLPPWPFPFPATQFSVQFIVGNAKLAFDIDKVVSRLTVSIICKIVMADGLPMAKGKPEVFDLSLSLVSRMISSYH